MTHSPQFTGDSRFLREVAFNFGSKVEAHCRKQLQKIPPGQTANERAILEKAVHACHEREIAAAEELADKPCNSD